jgi:hypothetical protein
MENLLHETFGVEADMSVVATFKNTLWRGTVKATLRNVISDFSGRLQTRLLADPQGSELRFAVRARHMLNPCLTGRLFSVKNSRCHDHES